MKKTLVIFLLLITLYSASAQIPDITGALSRMETAINESQEEFTPLEIYYLGRAAAAHLLSNFPLYTRQPALTDYLNLICYTLVINSTIQNCYNGFHVMILDTPVVNAFATPGGHIFLTRGILELVTSEDMLAAVIAHEMAHIQLQHSVAIIKHSAAVQGLSRERQRLNMSLSSEIIFSAAVGEIVQSLLSGGYSQLQEFEADSTAFSFLASAGYNPASLIELMRIFDSFQWDQTGSLNSTHPLPSQRIDNLSRQSRSINRFADNAVRRERFNRIMGRM